MTNQKKAETLMNAVLMKTLREDRKPSEAEQMVYDVAQAYLQLLENIGERL